jgi:uncharacterized protein (UPF0335 family)
MVDAAKVQSFADRVLALKAQEDEIKKEIREVYAEAVEDEIDKTGLGQLVTHLRKRGKAPEDFDAKEAIFLGYLELYNVALARTHAYARARTGEIIEDNEPAPTAPQLSAADAESQPLGTAEGDAGQASLSATQSPANASTGNAVSTTAPAVSVADLGRQESGDGSGEVSRLSGDSGIAATVSETPGAGAPAAAPTAHPPIGAAVPGSIRTERVPPVGVVYHDYLRCFPEYWSKQLADFTEDVKANGVRVPIVMQGNVVIDGRARYNAARHLLMEYPVEEYAGDDPLRDIIGLNMASRSLNLVERQSISKKLIKLVPDRADEIGELLDLQQQREAAQ